MKLTIKEIESHKEIPLKCKMDFVFHGIATVWQGCKWCKQYEGDCQIRLRKEG